MIGGAGLDNEGPSPYGQDRAQHIALSQRLYQLGVGANRAIPSVFSPAWAQAEIGTLTDPQCDPLHGAFGQGLAHAAEANHGFAEQVLVDLTLRVAASVQNYRRLHHNANLRAAQRRIRAHDPHRHKQLPPKPRQIQVLFLREYESHAQR